MSDHDFSADRSAARSILPPPWAAPAGRLARRLGGEGAIDRVTCKLGDGSCASAHAAGVRQSGGQASLHRSLLQLQREYGNRYVGQVLRQAGADGPEATGGSMDGIERSIDQARGGGSGMDHATRSQMETSFGSDFSGVRIHTDARADDLSRSLSARAFTTGRDVFFRQGEYSPGTSSGRELLAHELTHVVQQGGAGGVQRKMTVSEPGDPQEVEADEMARAVMAQEHSGASVQRQPEVPAPEEDEDRKKLAQGRRQIDGAADSEAMRPQ